MQNVLVLGSRLTADAEIESGTVQLNGSLDTSAAALMSISAAIDTCNNDLAGLSSKFAVRVFAWRSV